MGDGGTELICTDRLVVAGILKLQDERALVLTPKLGKHVKLRLTPEKPF